MQFWGYAPSDLIDSAINEDLSNVLIRFVEAKDLSFLKFKALWLLLGMPEIHSACPNRVKPVHYAHILFDNALKLLNRVPCTGTALDAFSVEVGELIWNIGVFYALYILYRTCPLVEAQGVRIRVGTEEWLTLLLASERMQLLESSFCGNAVSVFHKLLALDAFQLALYPGAPTLHQLVRSARSSTAGQSSALTSLLQGNSRVSAALEEVPRKVRDAGFSFPLAAAAASSSRSGRAETEEEDLSSGGTVGGQEWDDALRDFFGGGAPDAPDVMTSAGTVHPIPGEDPDSSVLPSPRGSGSDDEGESSSSVLRVLELLEQGTQEIMAPPPPPEEVQRGARSRRRKRVRVTDSSSADGEQRRKGPRAPRRKKKKTNCTEEPGEVQAGDSALQALELLERGTEEVMAPPETDQEPSEEAQRALENLLAFLG